MAVKKEIKIAYFPSETPKLKVLNTNGKSLDHYCTKAVTEEDLSTGNYLLDATFLAAETKDILHEEAILKVRMDYGEEVFRISKVTKGTRSIDIVARQITIADSLTLFIRDARPTNLKGQAALTWIMDRAEGVKEIEITSNIDTSSTSYYLDKNLYEVLHTADNSFIDRWGGEIQRRAYTIKINDKIGVDRGFSIREGKNLTGFEGSSNIDSLVTRAKGKGFNGIEGNFIDSDLINHYNRTYTSVIEYSDVKVKDEYNEDGFETEEEAKAELDSRIRKEFEENHIDQIKASYSINFIQLEKTEEYKSYQVAERAFIGDIVRVYIPKHDVDINVRVMKKKYDVLAQKTNEITLSNFIIAKPPTIKDVYESLESIKSENISSLQQAKEYASELIKSGLKNSYVIVREDEIIIGDTKDINTMVNVWRFNKNGLGFSSTGYYGEFGLAMTMNGAIVADFITVGVLNAALIKAGVLRSENGLSWLDMENGTFNFANKIVYDGTSLVIKLSDGQTLEYKLNSLVSEISDTKNGLNSKIEQTAEKIETKVSKGDVVSSINQSSESVKINANKIQLEGAVTIGTDGRKVKIENADYSLIDGDQRKGYLGFRTVDYDSYLIPRLALGHSATSGQNDYFAINPYRGNGENPQSYDYPYVDIAYKSANYNDWSNIKMYSDGVVRIAPLKELQITSNFVNGEYAGSGERLLAKFGTSASSYYNGYLQIGAIQNTSNNNGLILEHNRDGIWCGVRVNVDSNNDKYFRPTTNYADINNGSTGYPWKSVVAKNTLSSQGVVVNEATRTSTPIDIDNVIDRLEFIEPLRRDSGATMEMDVTSIINTGYVELSDDGKPFINETELVKLLLKEVQDLRRRVNELEK